MIAQGILVPAGLAGIAWAAVRHGDSISPKGSVAYLAAALCTLQLSLLVFARRLHTSLGTMGIRLPVGLTMRIALQSLFYFFFIPFSTGAELSRWAKIKAASPESSNLAVVTAVGFDRFMPAVACVAISLASLPFVTLRGVSASDTSALPVHPAIAVAVLLAAGAGAATVAVRRGWIARMLQLVQSAGQRFMRGLVLVGAASLLVQLLSITTMWLLSRWLGIEIGFAALALGTSGGMLAQVIPISLAGAGPAELGSGLLFAACGATTSEAVVLTTALYLCKLAGAVEGGLLEFPMARLHGELRSMIGGIRAGRELDSAE
jgi:Lysylphosphatidylglycerol synthase TM region